MLARAPVFAVVSALAKGRDNHSAVLFGGAKGGRTPDLLNAIQALSQLSYGPTGGPDDGCAGRPRDGRYRQGVRGVQAKSGARGQVRGGRDGTEKGAARPRPSHPRRVLRGAGSALVLAAGDVGDLVKRDLVVLVILKEVVVEFVVAGIGVEIVLGQPRQNA